MKVGMMNGELKLIKVREIGLVLLGKSWVRLWM